MELRFTAAVWEYAGDAAWHFVSVPLDRSDELRDTVAAHGPRRGFGAVRVRATLGTTSWSTSVFPTREGAPHPGKGAASAASPHRPPRRGVRR